MELKSVKRIPFTDQKPTEPGLYLFKSITDEYCNYPSILIVSIEYEGDTLCIDCDSWETWLNINDENIPPGYYSPMIKF